MSVYAGGRFHLRQHRLRYVQQFEEFSIPCQLIDIEQQRARSVGEVRHMDLAARELPYQPSIDGAEQQLATLRTLSGTDDLIQNPGYFRS
ncbi:hypothetical protein D3C73_1004410 [compost metagenome]